MSREWDATSPISGTYRGSEASQHPRRQMTVRAPKLEMCMAGVNEGRGKGKQNFTIKPGQGEADRHLITIPQEGI